MSNKYRLPVWANTLTTPSGHVVSGADGVFVPKNAVDEAALIAAGAIVVSSDAVVVPVAPTAFAAGSATRSSIALSWTAPSTGSAPITYTLRYRVSDPRAGYTMFASGLAGTSLVVGGLNNKSSYDFELVASNAGGNSPPVYLLGIATPA